jgi:hypothetical protein
VLAHGFSDDGLGWQPTACDLEAQFDVILLDAYTPRAAHRER